MFNTETPHPKFALYGAHSSLGSAVLCELLSRQHEAVALINDFNSIAARPGLRAKAGDLFDAASVSRSVAGMDGVICLFDSPSVPTAPNATLVGQPQDLYQAVCTLLLGMTEVGVERLLLVADFNAHAEESELDAALQLIASHPLKWTLVDVSTAEEDLSIEDFSNIEGLPSNDPRSKLRRIAAAMVDELVRPQHLHQQVQFRL
ncbi:MAG: NAD(P)-dependent oxidoreductase [Pseudomonas sp.]